jgi:hypothetical protein
MTLILCYTYGSGIMLLGDSGLALGGGPNPPACKPVPKKVQRSPNKAIAGALWGDMALYFNGNFYQPDLWFEQFLTTQVGASIALSEAKTRLEASLSAPTLVLRKSNGGFLLAGFESGLATAYELTCISKSDTDHTLNVTAQRISDAQLQVSPVVRGWGFSSWANVRARCRCGPLDPQNNRLCVQEYCKAVRVLAQQTPTVAEPVRGVYIKTNPFHRPGLNAPLRSSLAPPARPNSLNA